VDRRFLLLLLFLPSLVAIVKSRPCCRSSCRIRFGAQKALTCPARSCRHSFNEASFQIQIKPHLAVRFERRPRRFCCAPSYWLLVPIEWRPLAFGGFVDVRDSALAFYTKDDRSFSGIGLRVGRASLFFGLHMTVPLQTCQSRDTPVSRDQSVRQGEDFGAFVSHHTTSCARRTW
jgi:hypothetical protein